MWLHGLDIPEIDLELIVASYGLNLHCPHRLMFYMFGLKLVVLFWRLLRCDIGSDYGKVVIRSEIFKVKFFSGVLVKAPLLQKETMTMSTLIKENV